MNPEPRMVVGRPAAWWGAAFAGLLGSACSAPAHEPADKATYASTGSLACAASDVMWASARSDASHCEGPWEYEQYAVRWQEHEDCGVDSCAEPRLCTSWQAREATHRTRIPIAELADEQRTERVCGCERWRYRPCLRADPSLPHVTEMSAPGRTLGEVRAAHDAEDTPGQAGVDELRLATCTTAEEPGLTPSERFARLDENMQDPAIVAEGTPLHARFIERLMLVYELFGAQLTAADRAQARALYHSYYPAVEPACGQHVPDDMPPCAPAVDTALGLCTRLGSAHVSPALAYADYDACLALLTDLGDALEAGTCEPDAPYVEASQVVHRRLHDKLLVRFGDALTAVEAGGGIPDYDTAPIAHLLHTIHRWHVAARAVLTKPAVLQDELALVVNKLWQVAHGARQGRAWSDGSLYAGIAAALARADERIQEGDEAGARQEIEDALEGSESHALALDQAVLRAAYANVANTEDPVLTDAPLLHITAEALAPLADRLDALTQYHDLGCALARCATWTTPTRLSRLWRVLAHLDDGADAPVSLGDVLDSIADDLSGWKPGFRAMSTHQDRLLAALADAAETAHLRALPDLIDRAEARMATYERTGMLEPTVGQTLQTGVHSAQRQRVLDHIDEQRIFLESAHADMERRLVSLVHGLASVGDADATRARLEAARERVHIELGVLTRREASYRRLIADGVAPDETRRALDQEDALFEEIMAAWARAEGGADGAAYLRLGDTQVLRLSGADARFDGWHAQTMPAVAAGMRSVAAGQVISIATAPGTVWAPTCALRHVRLIEPGQALEAAAEELPLDTTGAVTGPEGYALTWTGSTYQATSLYRTKARRETASTSHGLCLPIPGLHYCPRMEETSFSNERGRTWQSGSEGRTSAQFASGLYLPITPFEAPAGSLVVVEMPAGEIDPARLRNVHLVRAPHTTIAVEDAADLYFVVNDIACDEQDSAHVLEVTVGAFVTLDEAADALVRRMAHTLALVRARAPEVIARGALLPTERRLIEEEALLAQLGGPGEIQIPVDDYPPALRTLFSRFLAREMVRLEAMAALAQLEAEQQIKLAEHRAISVELHQSTMAGYLLGLVPRWTVRGMRLAEMREVATDFTRDVRHFVVPLMDLWYPEVAASLPDLEVLQRLANVDVDTPVLDLVGWQAELGRALRRRIAEARLPYPSDDDTARKLVALRFPRPSEMDATCAHIPSARCPLRASSPTFRWATVAEATALWDALGDPSAPDTTLRHLTFRVQPDDIYEPYAGSAYLSCRRALPVVRKLGLILTGVAENGTPPEQRFIEGSIPEHARLDFVTTSGIWPFALDNPVWRALSDVPLVFTWDDYVAAEAAFLRIPQDVRGVSPFTTLELVVPEAVIQAWGLRDAHSIDLVMELESIRTGAPVAVPVCALDEEALFAAATAAPQEMNR